jgi:prevent-host-death family protein
MIRSSVSNTKNNLSALLNEVRSGETVLITDRDRPVAQIVPINQLDWDARLQEMARRGLVRLPVKRTNKERGLPAPLASGREVSAVEALVEERKDGR